jgi:hypothetical protein
MEEGREMSAAPTTYATQEDAFWTREYLLRHCEGYRVDSPDGQRGYVEEIVLLSDESTPMGFLVRGNSGLAFVSVHQIRDFSPRAQRIVVDPLPQAGQNRVQPAGPAPLLYGVELMLRGERLAPG